jgi:DNA mismatch repair protein MSH5
VELVQRVAQHGPALHRASAAAAEVDCLVALAQSARQYQLQRPKLTNDNMLSIHQGPPPPTHSQSHHPPSLLLLRSRWEWEG